MRTVVANIVVTGGAVQHFLELAGRTDTFADVALIAIFGVGRRQERAHREFVTGIAFKLLSITTLPVCFLASAVAAVFPTPSSS